jgi:hypothetical protein
MVVATLTVIMTLTLPPMHTTVLPSIERSHSHTWLALLLKYIPDHPASLLLVTDLADVFSSHSRCHSPPASHLPPRTCLIY